MSLTVLCSAIPLTSNAVVDEESFSIVMSVVDNADTAEVKAVSKIDLPTFELKRSKLRSKDHLDTAFKTKAKGREFGLQRAQETHSKRESNPHPGRSRSRSDSLPHPIDL